MSQFKNLSYCVERWMVNIRDSGAKSFINISDNVFLVPLGNFQIELDQNNFTLMGRQRNKL